MSNETDISQLIILETKASGVSSTQKVGGAILGPT